MSENNPSSETRLPVIGEEDAPFWEAARNHELRMQQCNNCDYIWWAPGVVCPECWSDNYEWIELSGEGEVKTWAIFHRPYYDDIEDNLPYNVGEIELEEGPRYLANIVGCDNGDIYQGMPVEVVFEDITDEITLPKFRPL